MDEAIAAILPHPSLEFGLLETVLHEGKSIRIANITTDSHSIGFPEEYPSMSSFLGVPIITDYQVIGGLYLINKQHHDEFTSLDQKLAEILAAHTALATRKVRLLQTSQVHERQLEALNRASLAITSELALHKVLQLIVDTVREMSQAEYAALGIPNAEGFLDEFIFSGLSMENATPIPHLPLGLDLLGAIIQEKKPIRIPRIKEDPRSVGFPPGHPPMDPFLSVPIMAGNEMLGSLYLTNKLAADEFTVADQDLVEQFAVRAAVVIQKARLHEEVSRLAVVEERTRIGMDLHDGIIQSIYAVGLTLESAKLTLPEEPSDVDQLLETAIAGLNDTIQNVRNFILNLQPRRFEGDLENGLRQLIREFQAHTAVAVTLNVLLQLATTLPMSISRTLFLTTQEALANIARHAHATHVVVTLKQLETAVQLTTNDDGQGFAFPIKTSRVGHGLSNMQTRAKALNGSFQLQSELGQGTIIKVALPFL